MSHYKHFTQFAVLALMAWSIQSAQALAALDADSVKIYGGTYLSDCMNGASPRVTVFADTLVVLKGNKRLAGNKLQAAHSFFGQSPPPHFKVALLSEAPGGTELMGMVYTDARGQYLTLDGDAKVRASLGPTLLSYKFRLCGSPGKKAEQTPTPKRQYALTDLSAPGLLYDARIKSIYYQALGAKRNTHWLAHLDGPSPTNKKIEIARVSYILASACKNHDCRDHNVVLLYAPAQGQIVGKIYERGRVTFIGQPSTNLMAELNRLWQAEWRQQH